MYPHHVRGGFVLKFDLNQTGLRRLFSAWQVEALEYMWEDQKPMISRDVHRYLEKKDIRTVRGGHGTVSRASVINFLNELVDECILTYVEKTGKGGYHRVYSLTEGVETRDAFKREVSDMIVDALQSFRIEE